jgi:hypothetical protein
LKTAHFATKRHAVAVTGPDPGMVGPRWSWQVIIDKNDKIHHFDGFAAYSL